MVECSADCGLGTSGELCELEQGSACGVFASDIVEQAGALLGRLAHACGLDELGEHIVHGAGRVGTALLCELGTDGGKAAVGLGGDDQGASSAAGPLEESLQEPTA